MNKTEFLNALRKNLNKLPESDINQHTQYYSEMIDDMVEDGLSEQEAIENIGTADEISAQISEEYSPKKINQKEKRKLRVWEIILLALGSPVWLSFIIAAFAVLISLFAAGGAVIISFYAAALALGASAVASIPLFIILLVKNNTAGGLLVLGSGFVCAGLTIFAIIGTNKLTKLYIKLCKKTFAWLVSRFRRKENAK